LSASAETAPTEGFSMKTFVLKPADVKPNWLLVDATDLIVGRLAAQIAPMLMGKHRPDYTPHVAGGDFVVVINASKLRFTGRKMTDKIYDKYTGYPSGRKTITAEELLAKSPETVLKLAVRRMLPKNKLAYRMITQLKVYDGVEHPHQAQQPRALAIET
jgi:large subunit ribosomal protein L13